MAGFSSSNATRVKGNDIDPDADGSVVEADHAASADSATDADTVDGQHAGDLGGASQETVVAHALLDLSP